GERGAGRRRAPRARGQRPAAPVADRRLAGLPVEDPPPEPVRRREVRARQRLTCRSGARAATVGAATAASPFAARAPLLHLAAVRDRVAPFAPDRAARDLGCRRRLMPLPLAGPDQLQHALYHR